MKAQHGSLKITRSFRATPARVFAAWSDPKAKAAWFKGPDGWVQSARELDFRVGGKELMEGQFGDKMATSYTAHFYDIVPNERIVYSYDVRLNGEIHSASVATAEFAASAEGTAFEFNEQIAFLDGTEGAAGSTSRTQGIGMHLDWLAEYLGAQ